MEVVKVGLCGLVLQSLRMTFFKLKITRRHRRSSTARRKGSGEERFSLQGERLRFRTDVTPSEVNACKSRLLELWRGHERFWRLLLDLEGLSRAEVIQFSTKVHRGGIY